MTDEPTDAAPLTGAERLAELERSWFRADAPRLNGKLERGSGSPLALLSPSRRKHYDAVEAQAGAEEIVGVATAALVMAQNRAAAARAVADATVPTEE